MSLPSSQAEEEHPSSRPMSPAAATREVPKASDRTQLEAKQVRLLDMPPITLDDTMRILTGEQFQWTMETWVKEATKRRPLAQSVSEEDVTSAGLVDDYLVVYGCRTVWILNCSWIVPGLIPGGWLEPASCNEVLHREGFAENDLGILDKQVGVKAGAQGDQWITNTRNWNGRTRKDGPRSHCSRMCKNTSMIICETVTLKFCRWSIISTI